MNEADKIQKAQEVVSERLRREANGRLEGVTWFQKDTDVPLGILRIRVTSGGESSVFTFWKGELLEGHGSRPWRERLELKSGEILRELDETLEPVTGEEAAGL